MNRISKGDLARQLRSARKQGLLALLTAGAREAGVEPAWVVAVASRETGMRNVLGDGGHGVGVMQIDLRYHAEALRRKADGSWTTREGIRVLIGVGCRLLAGNLAWARARFPEWGGEAGRGWMKIPSAAYNTGPARAAAGAAEGDADRFTTGGDYGRDVLARLDLLREIDPLLFEAWKGGE